MFDRRANNIAIFQDSMEWISENKRLQEALKRSLGQQKLYLETDQVDMPNSRNFICQTVVSTKRSFEAASKYAKNGKKVCVLNFASSTNPGGGVVNGSSAQEECLCRCSTLYPCLDIDEFWQKFYLPHRKANNPLYNNDCIYTPGITVFKSDISSPERMREKDWYQVDVLTCAAPNLRRVPSNHMNPCAGNEPTQIENDNLYQLHLQRIERIFQIAVANEAEVLILGAFGCGAFCNPPKIVAKAFQTVQKKYEQYFETIEYAVFCKGHETQNYDAFCKEFGITKEYDLSRFLTAHETDYQNALSEVKAGCKRTHWMWYIFPQIAGLGRSGTSQFYSISSLEEAKAYLKNPVLGKHTLELCEALLALETNDAVAVFHWPDCMKLKSCMTLFEKADPDQELFGKVLDKFFGGERDSNTIRLLSFTRKC